MDRGRIDTAAHPFCTGWSVNDIRLTTRFKPYLMSAIYGTLHEAGHGMYEQGSPEKWDRTPLAGGVSLGIHESQSRTWENIVGRSHAFVSWMLPHAVAKFPQLAGRDVKSVYRAINKVEPSFIRVEADEVTYNMHIMIRFECENAILKGELKIADLPAFWNSKYEEYLGITPANDAEGCLQDVHWSAGLIGYFPTYTFGNLLSYQFWTCLENDLGDTNPMMESGNFAPILGWLKDKIYSKGQSIPPQELVKQVTGKPIGAEDYLAGINKRYREIYDI
jgi:carboxypeptidase Taq